MVVEKTSLDSMVVGIDEPVDIGEVRDYDWNRIGREVDIQEEHWRCDRIFSSSTYDWRQQYDER